MNQDCMSCSGSMKEKLNLFKVACINYISNPVFYEGHYLDRRELISLQHVISDKAKCLIEDNDAVAGNLTALNMEKFQIPADISQHSTPKNRDKAPDTDSPSLKGTQRRLSTAASNLSTAQQQGKSLTKLGRKLAATLLDKLDLKD